MLSVWDRNSTLSLNQLNHVPGLSRFFGTVSRLGDGVFWYCLAIFLPIWQGFPGLWNALVMLTAGGSCTIIYKLLKRATSRPRPCNVDERVFVTTMPLDKFSFPSGHTLHAICFTVVATHALAWLSWILIPFTILVALSRMVLGLHYPSDVLAGALIGSAVGYVAIGFL